MYCLFLNGRNLVWLVTKGDDNKLLLVKTCGFLALVKGRSRSFKGGGGGNHWSSSL